MRSTAPALSVTELIEAIHERGMALTYDRSTDRLHLAPTDGAPIPAAICEAGRLHRSWLVHVVLGRASGIVLAPCDVCGEPTMTPAYATRTRPRGVANASGKVEHPWPRCRVTPRCKGRHRPRAVDLIDVEPIPRVTGRKAPADPAPSYLLGPRLPYPGRDDRQ